MGLPGWRLDPRKCSSSLPQPPLQQAAFPAVPIPFPLPLSLFSILEQIWPFWEGNRMDIPRIGVGAPGAQDKASHLQGEQPSAAVLWPGNPRFHPPVLHQVPRPLNPSPQASEPPGASSSSACSGYTFWELKDWVQWYSTRLSLGQWAGLAAWGASGASAGLAASLSSAEMGHQLQLVGVRLLGVAMTAGIRRRKEGSSGSTALSRSASHGLVEPAPLLSSLPPSP